MQRRNSSSGEDEISLLFQVAIKELDNIDKSAKKEKTRIVKDLAKNLEGKIPTDTISIEIVHQLRGKVSERFVHECLEQKYKQKHRADNARKQQKKKKRDEDNLAALTPLNSSTVNKQQENDRVLIDTSGQLINEQDSRPPNTATESPSTTPTHTANKEAVFQSVQEVPLVGECPQCSKYKIELESLRLALLTKVEFEFPMQFESVRRHMELEFKRNGGFGEVWFHGTLDIGTRKVTSASTGRWFDDSQNDGDRTRHER